MAYLNSVVEESDSSVLKGNLKPSSTESKDYLWKMDFTLTLNDSDDSTISFDKFYY